MERTPVNLSDKLASISDYWKPRVVEELNGQEVKLAKVKGVLRLEFRGRAPTHRPGGGPSVTVRTSLHPEYWEHEKRPDRG